MNEDSLALSNEITEPSEDHNTITFSVPDFPQLLVLQYNGDILVKGKLIENDKEIVDSLREFLAYWKNKGRQM